MTPFVTLPRGFAMTRRLAASSPIGTISMSSVELRVTTPFQLPLFGFYEHVSSMLTEADFDFVQTRRGAQLLSVTVSLQRLRCLFGGTRDVINFECYMSFRGCNGWQRRCSSPSCDVAVNGTLFARHSRTVTRAHCKCPSCYRS
jgi:hypothetical protein